MAEGPWLVTGGAGFVGRVLVQRLLDGGRDVVVLDSLTWAAHPNVALDSGALILEVDVADGRALEDALDHVKPAVVVHCAAETRVDPSLKDSAPFLQTNVTGAWNLARAATERGLRLVHLSDAAVYGDRAELQLPTEADPVRPTTALGASQACADGITLSWARAHGLNATVVRAGNAFGPGEFPEALLPRAARRWEGGKRVGLSADGFFLRDWLHVFDLAAGLEAAALKADAGAVVHLAGGPLRTEREVLLLWRKTLGLEGNSAAWSEPAPASPGANQRQGLDDTATRASLGWAPRLTLEEGLAQTAAWHTEHPAYWDQALARPEIQAQLASTWADA